MGGRYVVAEGTHGDGLTWVIWARRHEPRKGDLLSMIRVTDASGRILHGGGRAGPPLPPGHVLNVTSGGSDEGRGPLLARVDPRVRRLELKVEDGTTLDVPLYDCRRHPRGAVRLAAPAPGRGPGVGDRVRREERGTGAARPPVRTRRAGRRAH